MRPSLDAPCPPVWKPAVRGASLAASSGTKLSVECSRGRLVNAFLILFSIGVGQAESEKAAFRLPDSVVPLSYSVELWLTPGVDNFRGQVTIDLDVRRESSVLWLHSKDLTLQTVSLNGHAAQPEIGPNDFVAIRPAGMLLRGRSRLTIGYTGLMSQQLTDGLFHQRQGSDWYAFAKFEPSAARRAFPCFDEPIFKTPWQVTLRIPSALHAFSNTPLESEKLEPDGTMSVKFAQTKPLPTYLVSLAVGPFEIVNAGPVGRNRVPARLIVPKGRTAEAGFAADNTASAVALLEDYFGITYPYEKLDQVVVPVTAVWGATENAGLILYGDVHLLTKPDLDTIPRRRARLDLLLHELAHQWFGNLVTMKWWDDLWLNEAFASWIAAKLVNRSHPELRAAAFAVGRSNSAKSSDALSTVRKVRQPVEDAGDMAQAFNEITYQKGAAILRMIENWLGEEVFRRGVQAYVKTHAWGSASTPDLVTALNSAANRDLTAVFSSFLDTEGIPLVSANMRCDGKLPKIEFQVKRFVPIGSRSPESGRWRMPVCVRFSGSRECFEVSTERQSFEATTAKACPDWFYANENGAGYYRVIHEGPWSEQLAKHGGGMSSIEQLTLLQDVEALAAAGKVDAGEALTLVARVGDAAQLEVLIAAVMSSRKLSEVMPEDLLPNYSRFVRSWLGRRAHQLGWEPKSGESDEDRRIRLAIVPFVAVDGRDQSLVKAARDLAERWFEEKNSVDLDTAATSLLAAARFGDRAFFEKMRSELRRTQNKLVRLRLLIAMTAFPDPEIIRAGLGLLLEKEPVLDPQEARWFIGTLWRETHGTVWDFVRSNFDRLNTTLPAARGIPFAAELPQVGAKFCEESRAVEIEAFFKPRLVNLSAGQRNLNKSLESVRLCSARRVALEPGLRAFLGKH